MAEHRARAVRRLAVLDRLGEADGRLSLDPPAPIGAWSDWWEELQSAKSEAA